MDRNRLAVVTLGLLVLLMPGCLKKQSWEVTRPPVWPRYLVEGTVVDSITHDPLEQVEVTLIPVRFLFPDSFDTLVDTTDYLGRFSFGRLPASAVLLQCVDLLARPYRPLSERVVIQQDRNLTVLLPPSGRPNRHPPSDVPHP